MRTTEQAIAAAMRIGIAARSAGWRVCMVFTAFMIVLRSQRARDALVPANEGFA